MPKGLKATSSQIVVSFDLTESNPNTFTTERIDLQLNALDNEVFVVTGVKFDMEQPDLIIPGGAGSTRTANFVSVSKQSIEQSTNRSLGNPSVFATGSIQTIGALQDVPAGYIAASAVTTIEDGSDTPAQMEYVDIIATPDFHVNINGSGNLQAMSVDGKLYGYRARADASTYAALVQSELLSQ